jgi:hypothetical protein
VAVAKLPSQFGKSRSQLLSTGKWSVFQPF